MLMQIKLIIAAVIITALVSTSYLSYRFYGQVKVLEADVVGLHEDLIRSAKNTELTVQSCRIGEDISSEVSKIETDMVQKSAELLERISAMPRSGVKNEQTIESPGVVSADVELQRLLDDAYCNAATSDPYCTTR